MADGDRVWRVEQGEAVAGRGAGGDGVLRVVDGGRRLCASWLMRNPMDLDDPLVGAAGDARVVIVESGWLDGETGFVRGVVRSGFRTWTPAGWRAMEAMLMRAAASAQRRGCEVWVRSHARQVLSDPQSCLTWLRGLESAGWAQGSVRLLLDPASLLTAGMLGEAEDHVQRAVSAVAGHALLGGVVVGGCALVEMPPGDEVVGSASGPEMALGPGDAGALPAGLVARAVDRWAGGAVRVLM